VRSVNGGYTTYRGHRGISELFTKIGDDAVAASRPTPRNRSYGARAAITATVVLHKVHKAGAQLARLLNLCVAGLYLNTRAGISPCGVSRV